MTELLHISPSSCREIVEQYLKIGHGHSILCPYQLIVYDPVIQ